jgi:hypothetical protein
MPDTTATTASTASTATTKVPSPHEVHAAYHEDLSDAEQAALWSWIGFSATFAGVRGVTYAIKHEIGPFRNLSLGHQHLHHYLWGIAMVSVVGGNAIGQDEPLHHRAIAAATYGAGLALIVDEFALLLDLQDVYWAKQGRISIDLGVGLVGLGGTAVAALPLLRRLVRNRRH